MVAWILSGFNRSISTVQFVYKGIGVAMTCQITTSRKAGNTVQAQEPNVLFNARSSNTVSHIFHVDSCVPVKICTFGLGAEDALVLHKVHPKAGNMPQGYGCICSAEPGSSVNIEMSEPFKINGETVELTAKNSAVFLTIPGLFILEMKNKSMLGKVFCTITEVECCCLPNKLIIGN